jgi:hypothetical protein
MISTLFIVALAAHAAAPAAAPKKEAPPAKAAAEKPKEAPVMEWKGQYNGTVEAGHRLITDQRGWDALWRVLGKPAPALDFKLYNAVAVFLGERPTGGYTAEFSTREKEGDTLVSYVVGAPKGFVTQAFTRPFHVRAFPKPKTGKMLVMEAKTE